MPTPNWLLKALENISKIREAKELSTVAPKVKYYGPTMGKTYAAKYNSSLVDFDDVVREASNNILKKYGFDSKYHMFESGNQDALKAYQDMLVSQMQAFRSNPANAGKTLVVSQSPVVNPSITGFQFDNVPSIPSREVFIRRNIGRGGDYEGSAGWWDNLMKRNPNLKIDDRFISEIEELPIATFIDPVKLTQLAQDSDKYWKYLKDYQKPLIKDFFVTRLSRPSYYSGNSKMRAAGYNNTLTSIQNALEDASKAYNKVIETQNAVKPTVKPIDIPIPSRLPHKQSIQSIIDSDFVPFDEAKTLFQTGSKAKTTMDFRLSDYYKQGGIIKSIF